MKTKELKLYDKLLNAITDYAYETETGEKRSSLNVVAENIQLLPRGGERVPAGEQTSRSPSASASPVAAEEAIPTETEDDIPF